MSQPGVARLVDPANLRFSPIEAAPIVPHDCTVLRVLDFSE